MKALRARLLSPISPGEVLFIDDAVLVFDNAGKITEVGPYDGREVDEDLRPGVLLPGFVDAHIHFPQLRIVGAASGPLLEWLREKTFPEEQRFADPVHAAAMAEVFCTALAAAGTTLSMVYGSVHPQAADTLLGALSKHGLRAIAGPVLMDAHSPPELMLSADRALPALEELADSWNGHDDRLFVGVIPRFALSCTPQMLRAAGELAQRRQLWISTHLSENLEECRIATERFGTRDYLQVYEDAGLLGPRTVMAHCIHLSDSEWDRMQQTGTVVAHCPDSNFFLGSGNMPIHQVLRRDISLAIGTDLAAGRSFRVPRILSSAYDNGLALGEFIDPRALLYWGTRGGAIALGQPHVGALEPGMEADMICVDLPAWVEDLDAVLAWLLFYADAPSPRRTWVRGRVVWDREDAGHSVLRWS